MYSDDLYRFLQSRGMRIPDELKNINDQEERDNTVLIVEDDADLNDILKKFFTSKDASFLVHQAFDGFEAGRLLTETKPGVVVLDINLPGIDPLLKRFVCNFEIVGDQTKQEITKRFSHIHRAVVCNNGSKIDAAK